MLTRPLFEKICRKLERRENLFRIASETGVAHHVLCAIVDGWRPEFRRGRPRKNQKNTPPSETLSEELFSDETISDSTFSGETPFSTTPSGEMQAPTVSRCPECGGLVVLPCRKCALEKRSVDERKALSKKFLALETQEDLPLEIQLGPKRYACYLKIRAQKIQEELERNSQENADEWNNSGTQKRRKTR